MVSWGPAVNTSTNGMRVGLELSYSVSGATATVRWEIWLWTKRAAFNTSASYSVDDGVASGSFSFNHSNNSSDWPTNNRTRVATGSFTRTLQYGSTQRVGIVGRIWGVSAVGSTARHELAVTLPARGYNTPAAPTGAFVFPQSNYTRARLEWTNNPTGSAPYTKLQVGRRHIDASGSFTDWITRANLGGSASSYTDAVADNWHYHYRVRAGNSSGWSAWLDMGRLNTTPSTPSSVRAQHSGDNIRVTWDHALRIPASQVRTVVQHSADGGTWTTVATLTGAPKSWTHYSPSITQTHRYRVRLEVTEWGSATGSWGTSSTVELAAPPAAPTGLGPSTAFDATEGRTFTWQHVPTDGSEQTAYQVAHRALGAQDWTYEPQVDSDVSAWTLPAGAYSNGDTIEWRVRTWGAHPTPSEYSASSYATALARPTVAINIPEPGAVIDRSSVGVRWAFFQEQGRPQTGWRVELRRDGQVIQAESGPHQNVNVQMFYGLENDATYEAAVQVRATSGWSDWGTVTFTTSFTPPPTPSIEVAWDVELGAAVVQIDVEPWSTGQAEPDHVQLWRSVNDGEWLLIADQVPLDTAIVDPIPAIGDGTINYYRATTVSLLPSTADSAVIPLAVTTRDTRGWVYLNAGPGMADVCRFRDNATRSDSEGKDRVLRQYAGRTDPVPYSGVASMLEWTVAAKIAPAPEGGSTREELVAMQVEHGDEVCYRDPLGVRWFGAMSRPDFSWQRIDGEVSWKMTRVGVTEGLLVGASS